MFAFSLWVNCPQIARQIPVWPWWHVFITIFKDIKSLCCITHDLGGAKCDHSRILYVTFFDNYLFSNWWEAFPQEGFYYLPVNIWVIPFNIITQHIRVNAHTHLDSFFFSVVVSEVYCFLLKLDVYYENFRIYIYRWP